MGAGECRVCHCDSRSSTRLCERLCADVDPRMGASPGCGGSRRTHAAHNVCHTDTCRHLSLLRNRAWLRQSTWIRRLDCACPRNLRGAVCCLQSVVAIFPLWPAGVDLATCDV